MLVPSVSEAKLKLSWGSSKRFEVDEADGIVTGGIEMCLFDKKVDRAEEGKFGSQDASRKGGRRQKGLSARGSRAGSADRSVQRQGRSPRLWEQ